ncbi:MAG: NAD(P)/FAD-dependent oxidoreductase [Planctomycetota bacterium]|jgi:predicted NAD/FAD-dependent oxidoreductase
MEKIAIVGAGIAGLSATRALHESGREVVVFEKGRSVGGRMSTRRVRGRHIDHGAQYFTARHDAFRRQVDAWEQRGIVERWPDKLVRIANGETHQFDDGETRYRGTPGMNAVCRHLADGLAVRSEAHIKKMACGANGWELRDAEGDWLGPFSDVVLSIPAPQARALLGPAPNLARRLEGVTYEPCWAALMAFDEPVNAEFDAALVEGSDVAWIARRAEANGETWIVHATPEWSDAEQDTPREEVLAHLKNTLSEVLGNAPPKASHERAHVWRHSKVQDALGESHLWDSLRRVGVCGDGCLGGRVESAWLSGRALAAAIAGR